MKRFLMTLLLLVLFTGCTAKESNLLLNQNSNFDDALESVPSSPLDLEVNSGDDSFGDFSMEIVRHDDNLSAKYIFPSDSQLIKNSDLEKMSFQEIMLARNEIYARHGYDFQQKEIRNYFLNKSWYHPIAGLNGSSFDESVLNTYERINRDTIVRYELDNRPSSVAIVSQDKHQTNYEQDAVGRDGGQDQSEIASDMPYAQNEVPVNPKSAYEDIPDSQESSTAVLPLSGHVICLDPGHSITPLSGRGMKGPISPISNETKALYTEGTEGAYLTEEKLNLIVGLKLKDELKRLGADVLMTREVSEITITGVERCEIANKAGADVNIHIHADGVDDPGPHGVSVLVPTGDLLGTPSILDESVRLGKLMVNCVAETTGAKNRGISPRSDMTGFNFSEVPSVLIEMGFMTNPEEDALLSSDEYQNKIVKGIAKSLFLWYGIDLPY